METFVCDMQIKKHMYIMIPSIHLERQTLDFFCLYILYNLLYSTYFVHIFLECEQNKMSF